MAKWIKNAVAPFFNLFAERRWSGDKLSILLYIKLCTVRRGDTSICVADNYIIVAIFSYNHTLTRVALYIARCSSNSQFHE